MKIWDKYNWKLLALLFYCFVLAYFAPGGIAKLGFLPLLYFAYQSKNNAFWLVLLLIFIDNPAYFFMSGERDAIGRTPMYPFFGGGFSFNELLAFTFIIKSFQSKGAPITYKRGLQVLVILIVFVFLYSFAFTITAKSAIGFTRRLTMWIFLFSIPKLLVSKNDWIMFFKLLFPLMFLIFADQLQVFITGKPIAGIFNPEINIYHAMREVEVGSEQVSRALSGAVIIFIIYTGALLIFLNSSLKKHFKSAYLFILIFTAYISILLSATRGWFLAFTFMFVATALVAGGQQLVKKIAPYFIILIIAFFVVLNLSPLLQTQASNAWARISTLEKVAGGDLTAGGTVGRWTDVAPKLLRYVGENPLGYGFSVDAFGLENDHAGIVNPMIIFGVAGYAVILIFIFGFMAKIFQLQKRLPANHPYKKSLMVLFFSFMGLFAIHLTSRQIFGLNMNVQYNLLVPIIFGIGNWLIIESYRFTIPTTIERTDKKF